MRKLYALVAATATSSFIACSPALAGGVRNVSVQDALENKVIIPVAIEGGGVNLDFSETGEKIYKIAIDDPSLVSVDHCLVVGNCNGRSWPVIRLWRTGIVFDLPRSKTTKLSVFTEDISKDTELYEFQITLSQKPTAYTKYVIGGVDRKRVSALSSQPASSFQNGIRAAQRSRLIVDPMLMGRLKKYQKYIDQGDSPRKAARKAKISLEVANRIGQMGASSPTTAAVTANTAFPPQVIVPSLPKVKSKPQMPSQVWLPPAPSVNFSRNEVLFSPAPAVPAISSSRITNLPSVKPKPATAYLAPLGKVLSNYLMANKISLGLAVATSKGDASVTSYRYSLNNAIRYLRRQKSTLDVSGSIGVVAKKADYPFFTFFLSKRSICC
jgi:hypothetical protein